MPDYQYLFLEQLTSGLDMSLTVVINEGYVSDKCINTEDPLPSLNKVLKDSREVIADNTTPLYQIHFNSYLTYSVIDESYDHGDKYNIIAGKEEFYCIFSRSHFLDFISKETFATHEFPGPFQHYCIACCDHVIHVASENAPRVKQIR